MAMIRLKDNTAKMVSPEQGAVIWQVWKGEIKGTPQQRQFVKNVYRVYLNMAGKVPPSYCKWHETNFPKPEISKPLAVNARLPYID
jgi:hypothetical protein